MKHPDGNFRKALTRIFHTAHGGRDGALRRPRAVQARNVRPSGQPPSQGQRTRRGRRSAPSLPELAGLALSKCKISRFSLGRPAQRVACLSLPLLFSLALTFGCHKKPPGPDSEKPPGQLKLGYVLHGLNDFTQITKQGAEDAGRAEHVSVEVVGPAGFSATSDAIAMFEGMTQKKVHGLVVVPMPGEVWVTPIRQATEAGIPVLTANVTSPGSTATAWFGQDEYESGVILATELRKFLSAQKTREGRIIVGLCAPGVGVLVERYQGFKKGMVGERYQISEPFDVNTENTANYGAWENLATAHPNIVAMVGLCSMDLPNLAKLKVRTKAQWLIGGYDLGRETLDAVKAGTVQVVIGQHPYLQGYLPVVALARYLRQHQPLPQGWLDVGTEVVTRENADAIYGRETDEKKQTQWYADHVARHFADLNAVAKPLPKPRN